MHDRWNFLLDIVFPRTCLRCGCLIRDPSLGYSCARCREAYSLIREPHCDCCGAPFFGQLVSRRICPGCLEERPLFEQARSLFLYRRTGARLVHCLKYEKGTWLQREIRLLIEADERWQRYFEGASLIPIPLHPVKQRKRGYNQAEIVAQAIAEAIPGSLVVKALRRGRATPSQTFLSREDRRQNMRNAFESVMEEPSFSERMVLVDDVLTTGATLNAAAQALRRRGVNQVLAFTLAHG